MKFSVLKKLSPELRNALLNTVSDTAFLSGVGTALYSWPVSKLASAFNIARAGVSFYTRLSTEFEKAGMSLRAPDMMKSLARNRGASLAVSGAFLSCSSIAAAFEAAASDPASMKKAVVLLLFAMTSFFMAKAADPKLSEGSQSKWNAAGTASVNGGAAIALGHLAPLPIYGLCGLSTLVSLRLLEENKKPYSVLQPDMMISGACGMAAYYAFAAGDAFLGSACLFYTPAYLSMAVLKKHGGVVEWVQACRANKQKQGADGPKMPEI